MKSVIAAFVFAFAGAFPLFAGGANDRICNKEYAKEPIERTACRTLGERSPKTRDCLIKERHDSGTRGDKDTRRAEVDRHVKCWKEAAGGSSKSQ